MAEYMISLSPLCPTLLVSGSSDKAAIDGMKDDVDDDGGCHDTSNHNHVDAAGD